MVYSDRDSCLSLNKSKQLDPDWLGSKGFKISCKWAKNVDRFFGWSIKELSLHCKPQGDSFLNGLGLWAAVQVITEVNSPDLLWLLPKSTRGPSHWKS